VLGASARQRDRGRERRAAWVTCLLGRSIECDQVLEDQRTPAISARLNEQSAFRKPAKFDRREAELFGKRANLLCGAVIIAGQEHDPPAAMHGRILAKGGSDQMLKPLTSLAPRK